MAARLNPETGGYYAYSMRTFEKIYSRIQCQEELRILNKVTIVRAPYVLYSRLDNSSGESELNDWMYATIGVQSVEALLEVVPLSLLESYMVEFGLSFDEISYNWAYTALCDTSQIEVNRNYAEPTREQISELLPPEARYVLEQMAQMERDGISAGDALQTLMAQNIIEYVNLDNIGAHYQMLASESQAILSSPEFSPFFDPRQSRIANTQTWPYRSIAQVVTSFRDMGRNQGSCFLVGPARSHILVTAGHNIVRNEPACQIFQIAYFIDVNPGRTGASFPGGGIGQQINNNAWVGMGWINNRNQGDDWAVVRLGVVFNLGMQLSRATSDADFRARPSTRIVGYPVNPSTRTNPFMYD